MHDTNNIVSSIYIIPPVLGLSARKMASNNNNRNKLNSDLKLRDKHNAVRTHSESREFMNQTWRVAQSTSLFPLLLLCDSLSLSLQWRKPLPCVSLDWDSLMLLPIPFLVVPPLSTSSSHSILSLSHLLLLFLNLVFSVSLPKPTTPVTIPPTILSAFSLGPTPTAVCSSFFLLLLFSPSISNSVFFIFYPNLSWLGFLYQICYFTFMREKKVSSKFGS